MSDNSARTIKAVFATREAADMAIEHLTQENGINRADIFVQSLGSQNSAGTRPSGSDSASARGEERRDDGALQGEIEVSADVSADTLSLARAVFDKAGGRQISDR